MPHGGLLEGVRILDLSMWRPGPYATQLLGELGADIIKVERPGGDPMRSYPALFEALNVNKRSIMLDLKTPEGRERTLALATDADVVIEGFRPGVAARLGVGFDDVRAVNAQIVYCSVSGMGQTGPLATAPGHDLNYQAWAGALAPDGGDPVTAAIPVADLSGGLAAAYAICAALVRKLRTGEGEHIDVAMGDVLATWTGAVTPVAEGTDSESRGVPGYGMFATRDQQFVALGIITEDHFWCALCDALGLAEHRDLSFLARMTRTPELQSLIADAIRRRDRDEVVAALLAAGAPAAPVHNRAEMLAAEHFRARAVVSSDGSSTGHPVLFARQPATVTSRAPAIDEHHGARFLPRP